MPPDADPLAKYDGRDLLTDEFGMALVKESDRGAVLIASAWVEQTLERLLRAAFRQSGPGLQKAVDSLFDGPTAPLATFWAKTQLAYAMNLIPEDEYKYLSNLRQARNTMAHEHGHVDFDHPKVAARIPLPTKQRMDEVAGRLTGDAHLERDLLGNLTRKTLFAVKIASLVGLMGGFHKRLDEARSRLLALAEDHEQGRREGKVKPFDTGSEPPFIT